jgi:hypothetical protein
MRIAGFILALILLGGCSHNNPYRYYDSHASLPAEARFTKSMLRFVSRDETQILYSRFGVFLGVDNGSLRYVLLAPKRSESEREIDTPYQYYAIDEAVTFSPADAREFVATLDSAAVAWQAQPDMLSATYIDYYHVQEQDKRQVSESVETIYPDLKLFVQIDAEVHLAHLTFNRGTGYARAWYLSADDLRNLSRNFTMAIERIDDAAVQ